MGLSIDTSFAKSTINKISDKVSDYKKNGTGTVHDYIFDDKKRDQATSRIANSTSQINPFYSAP
jgi:hypothetical protein